MWILLSDDGCDVTTTTAVRPTPSAGSQGTPESSETTVQVCNATTVADLTPLFAIAGLLLLGELSELSIPGIVSLKRRVTEQEQELTTQGEELRALAQQVQDVRVNVAQSASARNENHFYASAEAAAEKAEERARQTNEESEASGDRGDGLEADGAEQTDQSGDDLPDNHASETDSSSLSHGDLGLLPGPAATIAALQEREILTRFGRLEPYIALGRGRTLPGPLRGYVADLHPWQQDVVRRWNKRWASDIDLVRSVRNAIAHPPAQVTESDRKATIKLLRLLTDDLDAAMKRAEHSGAANL